jgi:hypothetical protein
LVVHLQTSNDEVERRAPTKNEDALSQSFDYLLTSPKLHGRSNRLLGIALPPKARMSIVIHYRQEILDSLYLRGWLIPVPFQISTHPKNTPPVDRAHISGFCHPSFVLRTRSTPPNGANLKYFDALACDTKAQVKLRPYVRSRPPRLNEGTNKLFDSRCFNLRKSHYCGA